ncbi:hypothetical protein P7C70_g7638, partial [Phenoliferia sp. Uapishka_3]
MDVLQAPPPRDWSSPSRSPSQLVERDSTTPSHQIIPTTIRSDQYQQQHNRQQSNNNSTSSSTSRSLPPGAGYAQSQSTSFPTSRHSQSPAPTAAHPVASSQLLSAPDWDTESRASSATVKTSLTLDTVMEGGSSQQTSEVEVLAEPSPVLVLPVLRPLSPLPTPPLDLSQTSPTSKSISLPPTISESQSKSPPTPAPLALPSYP